MSDVKSYSVPGLVESSLNPTLRFVTLADFDTLQREVERLEQFRAEIQAICENGKHRIKHTQLQMCGFLDGLRLKAVMNKPAEDPVALAIETEARAIYESWSARPGFVPWVEGGNSTMQGEARAEARRAWEKQ